MADVSSGCTIKEIAPNAGLKLVTVETAATVDSNDTIAITLANYGIVRFLSIFGATHTTDGSVVITEAPTTSVTSGVLTVTVGGASSNQVRVYTIVGQ